MWSMKKEGMKESREMYLKAIYILSKRLKGSVRNTNIAEYLNISRPSVSKAVSNMSNEKLIDVDSWGIISLTNKGKSEAYEVIERYSAIVEFLKTYLDLEEDIICADACKIEHIISDELFFAIKEVNLNESIQL